MIKSIFTASLTFITFAHGLAVTDALVTKASSDPVVDVTFPPGITIPGPDPTPRSDLPPGVHVDSTPPPAIGGPDPTPRTADNAVLKVDPTSPAGVDSPTTQDIT